MESDGHCYLFLAVTTAASEVVSGLRTIHTYTTRNIQHGATVSTGRCEMQELAATEYSDEMFG